MNISSQENLKGYTFSRGGMKQKVVARGDMRYLGIISQIP